MKLFQNLNDKVDATMDVIEGAIFGREHMERKDAAAKDEIAKYFQDAATKENQTAAKENRSA